MVGLVTTAALVNVYKTETYAKKLKSRSTQRLKRRDKETTPIIRSNNSMVAIAHQEKHQKKSCFGLRQVTKSYKPSKQQLDSKQTPTISKQPRQWKASSSHGKPRSRHVKHVTTEPAPRSRSTTSCINQAPSVSSLLKSRAGMSSAASTSVAHSCNQTSLASRDVSGSRHLNQAHTSPEAGTLIEQARQTAKAKDMSRSQAGASKAKQGRARQSRGMSKSHPSLHQASRMHVKSKASQKAWDGVTVQL